MGEFGHFYELPAPDKLSVKQMSYYANPETHPDSQGKVIDLTLNDNN